MDSTASIVMAVALLFYTVGVWTEKIQGRLTLLHLVLFLAGLIFDTWGTGIMFRITDGISFSFHGIFGLIAITLMFLHASWALIVLIRNERNSIRKFHRYSLFVWVIWLVPYLSPMFLKFFNAII